MGRVSMVHVGLEKLDNATKLPPLFVVLQWLHWIIPMEEVMAMQNNDFKSSPTKSLLYIQGKL